MQSSRSKYQCYPFYIVTEVNYPRSKEISLKMRIVPNRCLLTDCDYRFEITVSNGADFKVSWDYLFLTTMIKKFYSDFSL